MNLCNISNVKMIMEKYGLRFRKEFGQNFLTDITVVEDIADACSPTTECTVLEIGPGIGTLTQELCKRYKKVIALEIDRGLIPVLEETLGEYSNVTVYNQDVMECNLEELLRDSFQQGPVYVCANLPYYITSPILMKLLESKLPFKGITLMIQKEVADRLASPAGKADYGAISAVVQYYANVEKLFVVNAGKFMPPPKVNSEVVRLTMYEEKPYFPKDEKLFFRTIKAAFAQRRKQLLNSLASNFSELTKEQLRDTILECGFREDIRGECLNVEMFVNLSNMIGEYIGGKQ